MRHGRAGGEPLAWAELHHWATLTGQPLAPWQAEALMHLDSLFVAAWRKGMPKPAAPPR